MGDPRRPDTGVFAVVDGAADSVAARIHTGSEAVAARVAQASGGKLDAAALAKALALELEAEGLAFDRGKSARSKPADPAQAIAAELVREMAQASTGVSRVVSRATIALVVALLGSPGLDALVSPSGEAMAALRAEVAAARAQAEAEAKAAAADREAIRAELTSAGEVSSGVAVWLVGQDQCRQDPSKPCPGIPPSVRIRAAQLERSAP